jgi:sulfate permease, SulP family
VRASFFNHLTPRRARGGNAIGWRTFFCFNSLSNGVGLRRCAGARRQIAQLAFAGVVLVVLLFLTGPLQYLPRCVLASVVFTIAVGR